MKNTNHDELGVTSIPPALEDKIILTDGQRARWESKIRRNPVHEKGCHEWTAGKNRKGYGLFRLFSSGRANYARGVYMTHRLSFLIHRGPIPPGLCVCHSCDNPACVNPEHLWLGTNEDNVADRVAKDRTARGEKNGAFLKPWTHLRGDAHPARTNPEIIQRGVENVGHKINDDIVREIRSQYASGAETQTALGKRFGISSMTVSNICRYKKWAHVK